MNPLPLPDPHLRRAYVDCSLGQLHLQMAGPADGSSGTAPPLVLFHQNPSTAEEYHHLLLAMAADRVVIAFDTPGYGMSDAPSEPQSITGYVAVMAEGIAALGLTSSGPVDIFGFHTGAFLAIEAARQLGANCGRIALCGIPLRSLVERATRLAEARAIALPTADGAAILTRLQWLWNFLVAERVAAIPIERAAQMFMERARPLHRYAWAYQGVWTYEAEARMAGLTQPTLVLVLVPDELLADSSRAAAAIIPRSTIVEMPGLSRDIFEPAGGCGELAAALRAFLD